MLNFSKKLLIISLLLICMLFSGCTNANDEKNNIRADNSEKTIEALPEKNEEKIEKKKEDSIIYFKGKALEGTKEVTLEQLKSLEGEIIEEDYFSLNSYGTKEYFLFKGISLWHILKNIVIINDTASKVTIIAQDNYTVEYTIDDIKRDDYIDEQNPEAKYKMIIAWEENNIEYNPEEGNPFRLVVGQKEPGDINKPNWVQNIKTIIIH